MNILVVGAGISGIYAAYLLKNNGFEVTLLEASAQAGGRIKAIENFADFPLEAGAQYMLGKHSLLYDYADFHKIKFGKQEGREYYYFDNQLVKDKKLEEDKAFIEALTFFETLYAYDGPEQTLAQAFTQLQDYNRLAHVLAGFAAEFGTSPDRLGIKSLAKEESMWTAGRRAYYFEQPVFAAFTEFYDHIKDCIVQHAEVTAIDYSQAKIQVSTPNAVYQADKVIVTVPLAVLKKHKIQFVPQLPPHKLNAIATLGMDPCIRVFLKFKTRFWKKKMQAVYGGKYCHLYDFPGCERPVNTPVIGATIVGTRAEQLSRKDKDFIANLLLAELDTLFAEFGQNQATQHFDQAIVVDWGADPHIGGGFSYATPNSQDQRLALAQNVQNKIYFAGEATNTNGHNATLHGALESAENAVEDIFDALMFNDDTDDFAIHPDPNIQN